MDCNYKLIILFLIAINDMNGVNWNYSALEFNDDPELNLNQVCLRL